MPSLPISPFAHSQLPNNSTSDGYSLRFLLCQVVKPIWHKLSIARLSLLYFGFYTLDETLNTRMSGYLYEDNQKTVELFLICIIARKGAYKLIYHNNWGLWLYFYDDQLAKLLGN